MIAEWTLEIDHPVPLQDGRVVVFLKSEEQKAVPDRMYFAVDTDELEELKRMVDPEQDAIPDDILYFALAIEKEGWKPSIVTIRDYDPATEGFLMILCGTKEGELQFEKMEDIVQAIELARYLNLAVFVKDAVIQEQAKAPIYASIMGVLETQILREIGGDVESENENESDDED